MKIPENDLARLHEIQLDLVRQVRSICEANDIKYFIIAGTLLGAVRHGGFIPWDDDIDVGMLREDYEKFLACAPRELSSDYFLQSWHSDAGFGLALAKLRKQNTAIIEENSANTSSHKGIFLDIFPYDEKPPSIFKQAIQNTICYALKRLIQTRRRYSTANHGPIGLLAGFWLLQQSARCITTRGLISILENQMRRYNGRGNTTLVTIGGSYGYQKESLKRRWIEELTQISFEGIMLPCFREHGEYLEHMYGNYMLLPPEEKRGKRHGVVSLSFGDETGP